MSLHTNKFDRLTANKDRISASEWNRLVGTVEKLSRSEGGGIVDSRGLTSLQRRSVSTRTLPKKIFTVLDSVYSGYGIYYVYEQLIDDDKIADTAGVNKLTDYNAYTTWADETEYARDDYVEIDGLIYRAMTAHTAAADNEPGTGAEWEAVWKVAYATCLNLFEAYPLADYTPALTDGDIIIAWRFWTDDPTARDYPMYAGIPLAGSQVRMAKATEAAGAAPNITCNLLNPDGNEITTGLGSAIEVYAKISPAAVTHLHDAIPRIVNDDEFPVIHIQGKWWFATQFQGTTDCDCVSGQATSYNITNEGVDRAMDADGPPSNDELADVLGTLINDLISAGIIT